MIKNHIVLIHPAIPQNTGNIMRTCVATNTTLHLIEPLGFTLSDKQMKRAGLDYVKFLKLKIHPSFESFYASEIESSIDSPEFLHFFDNDECEKVFLDKNLETAQSQKYLHFFTRYSKCIYTARDYSVKGEHFYLFGHEHDGIPHDILKEHLDECVRIPMFGDIRSLNLSNCVAIGLYEALRQQEFLGLSTHEVQKGEDFLYA